LDDFFVIIFAGFATFSTRYIILSLVKPLVKRKNNTSSSHFAADNCRLKTFIGFQA